MTSDDGDEGGVSRGGSCLSRTAGRTMWVSDVRRPMRACCHRRLNRDDAPSADAGARGANEAGYGERERGERQQQRGLEWKEEQCCCSCIG